MSESNFREIQLNTKQVVFLFMAFVVAVVGVFLLGVQVGQGLKGDSTVASAAPVEPANDAPAPTVLPPATSPKADSLTYHDQLQGKADAKPAATPSSQPADAPPNPSADAPPDKAPAATPAATPAPKATPAASAKEPPAKPSPSATAGWSVQTGSFSSKANADRQLADLKSKGHAFVLYVAPSGTARFKVRMGPLERNAADTLRNRLAREGVDSTVTR